jgi:hypothetical protein
METNEKDKNRQSYEKPKLRTIELAAEEILAVGCKTAPTDPGQSQPAGCLAIVCSQKLGT